MTWAPPRSRAERRRGLERQLTELIDLWVATATPDGQPFLVPLSHHWDGATVLLATAPGTRTARNVAATGRARLALGGTRDVGLIDGTVQTLAMNQVPTERAEAFVAHTGFDPRPLRPAYVWLLLTPDRIQAWREENEIDGRDLMHEGRWLPEGTS